MAFRKKATKLPPAELSDFLCKTVLIGGVGAIVPMIFFSFEAASCILKEGLGSKMCENTSNAAMLLSINFGIAASLTIIRRAVPSAQRGEGLTLENLAILKLKKREKIQGILALFTTFSSMLLFSVLEIQSKPDTNVLNIGVIGSVTLLAVAIIEFYTLAKGMRDGEQPAESPKAPQRNLGGAINFKSDRRLSLRKVESEMKIISLV